MTYRSFSIIIIIVFSFLRCKDTSSPDNEGFIFEVDHIFEDWKTTNPGGAVAIIQNGAIIYEKYYGMADLVSQTPFSKYTRTDIGSISKQFTAYIIALLETRQQLSIEDDIRKYLPEIPFYGDTIKIKNLLFHTSGIKDYEALVMIQGRHYFDEHMTNQYVLNLMSKQKSPNFKPDITFEYSNSNYILLTEIIERITARSINAIATEEIFDPLGMDNTSFQLNQGADFLNRAIGYVPSDTGFVRPMYQAHLIGDGGIFTTLQDMIKWDQHFFTKPPKAATVQVLQRMKHTEKLRDGSFNSMGFAQVFTTHPFGEDSWSHGGSGGGYRSFYIRFEVPKFSVIVLSNSANNNAFEKANQIVNLYFDDPSSRENQHVEEEKSIKTNLPTKTITTEIANRLSGYYYDEASLSALRIQVDSNNNNFEVSWMENNAAAYIALPINANTIVENEDHAYQYTLDTNSNILLHKVGDTVEKTWKKLDRRAFDIELFSGSYYAAEVGTVVEFINEAGRLISTTPFLNKLYRIGNTTFLDEHTNAIACFELDSKGRVVGFSINIPRGDRSLRKLQFTKMT